MTSTTVRPAAPTERAVRPGRGRTAAVAATTFLAGFVPTVWFSACALQLATGTEADHRFHQVTGQGLLMMALWLYPVLALGRAGLRGRRPSTAAALLHLSVMGSAVLAGVAAPDAGGGFVAVLSTVTGALLWAALPVRPQLRPASLDPVLAPLPLLAAALVTPFVLGELELQRAMGDEHAEMAHYFDMAWVCLTLVGAAAAAALSSAARRLAVVAGLGLVVVGAARWAFTGETAWSALAVLLGLAGAAAGARRSAA